MEERNREKLRFKDGPYLNAIGRIITGC